MRQPTRLYSSHREGGMGQQRGTADSVTELLSLAKSSLSNPGKCGQVSTAHGVGRVYLNQVAITVLCCVGST